MYTLLPLDINDNNKSPTREKEIIKILKK